MLESPKDKLLFYRIKKVNLDARPRQQNIFVGEWKEIGWETKIKMTRIHRDLGWIGLGH